MPLPPYDKHLLDQVAADLGALIAIGEGDDVDEAFDAVVTDAYNHPVPGPSFAGADPGAVETVEGLHSLDEAIAAAVAWVGAHKLTCPPPGPEQDDGGEEGGVGERTVAFAVRPRSAHTRVTRRAKVEGVEHQLNETSATGWLPLPDSVAQAALEAGAGPVDGEFLERVTLTRRARYKPVATPHKGKSAGEFVGVVGDTLLTRGHATAGVARRAVVEKLKELGHDSHDEVCVEVYKLTGRDEGRPLITVARERIKQTLNLKLVYAARKEAAREPKVVGWVFVSVPSST